MKIYISKVKKYIYKYVFSPTNTNETVNQNKRTKSK